MPESIGRQTDGTNLFMVFLHIPYIFDTNQQSLTNTGPAVPLNIAKRRFIALMNRLVSFCVSRPIHTFSRLCRLLYEST